jgi:hypothetical protein
MEVSDLRLGNTLLTYVQNDLIEELHGVAAEHQRNYIEVDLSPQSVDVYRTSFNVAMETEEIPCRISDSSLPNLSFTHIYFFLDKGHLSEAKFARKIKIRGSILRSRKVLERGMRSGTKCR